MPDQPDIAPPTSAGTFEWHPEYAGQTYESLHRELVDRIARDQKAYQTALESAEKEEHGAFNTVRDLEKRWSGYDFAWFELKPELLADRVLRFEQEREARRELISWQEWKSSSASLAAPGGTPGDKRDWRENLSDEQRKRVASALAILIILGTVLVCMALYFVIR